MKKLSKGILMKTRQTIPARTVLAARTAKTGTLSGKTVAKSDARAPGPARIRPAERRKLIEGAAYFRAEKRNFAPGGELQDWLEAEAEIERLLRSS